MHRQQLLVVPFGFASFFAACDAASSPECDAALAKNVASLEARLAKASSDGEKKAVKEVLEANEKHFPGVCSKLDDKGKACLKRLDEFHAAGKKSDEQTKACFEQAQGGEGSEQECIAASEKRKAEALGDCLETMNKLEAEVGALAQSG